MKSHIHALLASERRRQGLSQAELAARAGLRREKLNRVESKQEDLGFDDMARLLDALGWELVAARKSDAEPDPAPALRRLAPQSFRKAGFIDGAKAKILDWGKIPG